MSSIFIPFEKRKLSAKNKALLFEWKELHEMCKLNPNISYQVIKYNRDDLPVTYEITFYTLSFVELDKDKPLADELVKGMNENADLKKLAYFPKVASLHRMKIIIPPNFPQVNAKPKGCVTTPIWHPNVVCHGDDDFIGRVCFNEGNLDASVTIVDRILQVEEYLKYKNYFAEEREPYPYDLEVALWVREIAEPQGWLVPGAGINYEKLELSTNGEKERFEKLNEAFLDEDPGMEIIDDDDEEGDEVFDFSLVESNGTDELIEDNEDEIYDL